MIDVLEAAMARADGGREGPFVEVYVSRRYGEVIAKEFAEPGGAYGDYFRTAALAIVHADPACADRSLVELHTTTRGPFHTGRVEWRRDLQSWIDAALKAHREGGERSPPAIRSLRGTRCSPAR
jgi:hypothetical protein